MFSTRVPAAQPVNRLSRIHARLRAQGVDVTDLTESNPTRVGLHYPPDLLDCLGSSAALRYDPSPRGLPAARQAVASWLSRLPRVRRSAAAAASGEGADRGRVSGPRPVDPGRIALTASTSEAYACVFKLLCDPGDSVLVPQPSYPLLEHLARFEGVKPVPYRLVYHGAWRIDLPALREATGQRARAIIVVNPNNPTGSFLAPDDFESLTSLCRERGLRLIVDEVFNPYPIDPFPGRSRSVLERPADVLTFVLGGLSKAVGLPQVKLGWIAVDGPDGEVDPALDALDLLLDTYLSVSTPVQLAAERLLTAGTSVRDQIRARIAANHRTLVRLVAEHPAAGLLRTEGGWYAVIQVPAVRSEETLALELLKQDRILVHPGYFFDFPREAFLVTSLLPEPERCNAAMARVLARATRS
ncbi:MAG: pyridoxal phosphate-dependent aminotransferase [Acidobacteria bacterium]|nr:pyridoxal phosphate-dependent aminotransferase [Acidobacteriota bacterium]MYK89914.1 pyridoxal phosphate-dependent aminotransferase [Acidobacteriota bacterium]